MKAKVVVCASGEGSNFEALVVAARAGRLAADVVGLITNRDKIGAIGRARRLGVPHQTITPKSFATRAAWDQAFLDQLQSWGAEWIVLAGFLVLIGERVLAAFPSRIVNSHPALLPRFGGPGMYGDKVHAAVLAARARETGVTIHLIDEVYDRGRILAQERLTVDPHDTVASLADRVKALENSFYPKVLNDLVTGRITIS